MLTIPSAKPDVLQLLSMVSRLEIMCQQIIETPSKGKTNGTPVEIKNYANIILKTSTTKEDPAIKQYFAEALVEDVYAKALNEKTICKCITLFLVAKEVKTS